MPTSPQQYGIIWYDAGMVWSGYQHHGAMHIAFPNTQNAAGPAVGTVVLEMATAEEMPHTVYVFLSRVVSGLHDGCAFYHNSDHETLPNVYTPLEVALRQRFANSGLEKVHFQEYNEAWPHLEWTVGLAGRPGGTVFHINKRDNSVDHGPGGIFFRPES